MQVKIINEEIEEINGKITSIKNKHNDETARFGQLVRERDDM